MFCSSLLKGRTVVLVTQLPWVAAEGDCVVTMENGRATTEKRIVTRKPKPVTGTTNQETQQDHMQKEDRKDENGSATDDESDEEVVAFHAHRLGRFQCELPHAASPDCTNNSRDG